MKQYVRPAEKRGAEAHTPDICWTERREVSDDAFDDDDEPITESERASINRAWADVREGRTYFTDELLARLGLVPNAPGRTDSEE